MSAPDADGVVEELLADGAEESLVEAAELRLGFRKGLRLNVGLEQRVVEVHCRGQTRGAGFGSTTGDGECLFVQARRTASQTLRFLVA